MELAVARLAAEGAGILLHAGDFVAPFVLPALAKPRLRVEGVFGNNDGEKLFLIETWEKHLSPLGGVLKRGPRALDIGGKHILLMHEPDEVEALADSGRYDLVVHGHTHDVKVERRGKCLVVNPGEVYGLLRNRRTVALYDAATHEAKILDF